MLSWWTFSESIMYLLWMNLTSWIEHPLPYVPVLAHIEKSELTTVQTGYTLLM